MLELTAPGAAVLVSPHDGGRIASIAVDGHELLVTGSGSDHPMQWGAFPMIPWAGRIRHGRLTFDGITHQLPLGLPPHAIHGTTYDRPWEVEADGSLAIELGPAWPFGGRAVQRFALDGAGLTCTIEVHAADRPMPAQAGWHPWFRRPVTLRLDAGAMYERDAEGIPSGHLVPVPPGPWDDCFTGLAAPPRLEWPDGPTVVLTSSCTDWVVYTQPEHALCVEPQTGPPDAPNTAPTIVVPGAPLVATMRLTWA